MNFDGSSFLVTGGTGSFGKTMVKRLLSTNITKVVVFSRDEEKQDHMRHTIKDERIHYEIGDVRDKDRLFTVTKDIDYIFHAAALKQVPSCEFYPKEAVLTNINGTQNIIDAAVYNSVKASVLLSTDKAVYPINAMGTSKAMAEKLFLAAARYHKDSQDIKFCITRYGNVMGSRGSVIPIFIDQINNGNNLTITNPEMTRFLMSLEESVDLVLHALENGDTGDLFIKKAPASTVSDLADAIMSGLNKKVKIDIIGERHGEKLYETLISKEEMAKSIDLGSYIKIPADLRPLKYEKTQNNNQNYLDLTEYNSHNTERLDINKTLSLLKKSNFV